MPGSTPASEDSGSWRSLALRSTSPRRSPDSDTPQAHVPYRLCTVCPRPRTPGPRAYCVHQAQNSLATHKEVTQQPGKALKKPQVSERPLRKQFKLGWWARTRAEATVTRTGPSRLQGLYKPIHPSPSPLRAVPLWFPPALTPWAQTDKGPCLADTHDTRNAPRPGIRN